MAKKTITQIDRNLAVAALQQQDALRWLPASDKRFTMRGLAWWKANKGSFCRLPLAAEKVVRPEVWQLAQSPASARLAFRSDTTRLAVRVTNDSHWAMPHMAATGSNGLILYTGEPYRMHPWCNAIPDQTKPEFERELFTGLDKTLREFNLYLPLYRSLLKLEIGIDPGAKILPPSPLSIEKPVVVYGTSITQGGCASTPGSDWVSTVGRMLNIDMVNLGFSGNGKGEPELAHLLAQIDAALYILDYPGNTTPKDLRKSLPTFLSILRKKRPDTPVLFQTPIVYSWFGFKRDVRERILGLRDVMLEAYVKARKKGDANLHLVDGFGLLPFGTDNAFCDGGHPADHGFRMIAERMAPAIEQILYPDAG